MEVDVTATVPGVHSNSNPQDVINSSRGSETLFNPWMARALQLDVLGLPVGHLPMRLQHRFHGRDSRNQ
jgi:hypothetical protein